MGSDYTKDVRRFGGSQPYIDARGKKRNLRHEVDFDPSDLETDGAGNITRMPLLRKKPCFGRPERFYRGLVGGKPWEGEDKETRIADTPCDLCRSKASGVFKACGAVVDERVASNAAIGFAIKKWIDTSDKKRWNGRRLFYGSAWRAILEAIVASGGWTNVNDDQVKLEDLHRQAEKRRARNEKARQKRAKQKALKKGTPPALRSNFFIDLENERRRRAAHLKSLRHRNTSSPHNTRWIDTLSDSTCERVADVWAEREVLIRMGFVPTSIDIAKRLIADRPEYSRQDVKSLATRVGEDNRKRLRRLEDDSSGPPLWAPWN